MEVNVGGRDRQLRLVIGPLLVVLGIAGYIGVVPVAVGPLPQALTSVVLVLVGVVLAVTGQQRKCPINSAVGRNTAR